jgi:hypothetical protein
MIDLIERLERRLKSASPSDRAYERPMTWPEAGELLAALRAAAAREDALVEALEKIANGTECWQRDTALDALAAAKGDAP